MFLAQEKILELMKSTKISRFEQSDIDYVEKLIVNEGLTPEDAVGRWAVLETERRYKLMEEANESD